ncbi:MAG: dihydrodipicolinate reductase [Acidobacteria bacterium]|jgi:4-hydroxy-tetrahydrodipicolinate reductase|nr:MAG: dihydrodipicolinate reductase [Acidobacteria bacterium 13_2_20CM_58_27]PYT86328.1 MAG: dihydrodipicolinate reductase [Acidobacteriota bacterium]
MSLGLAIVGNGKMGRLIAELAPQYGFDVRAKFTRGNNLHDAAIVPEFLQGVDAAVEFTTPDAAPANLRRLVSLGINAVCGTTGWYEHLPAIHEAVLAAGTGLVYSPNFSVGVNVFMRAVAHAACFFAKYPEYEAWGWEIHHSAKKDAPSGTLKKLAQEIRASGYNRALTLTANRAGAHPGTHEIGFDSADDTITLRHTARSREGFARGALRAARWLAGKQGVFEFREILGELS